MLILGLLIFLGIHCVGFFPEWRQRRVNGMGLLPWKGLYSLIALAGFVLIVLGFQRARLDPVVLYAPPAWLGHLNALFTLVAFMLLAAAYVPGNRIRARLGHPMVVGTKVWAFGHLLAIGLLHDVVLFGAFLVWAIVAFARLRRRDRAQGVTYAPGTLKGDVITLVVGVLAWALFAFWLHGALIGVRPFG
jgi:uncharacterized membrane protein